MGYVASLKDAIPAIVKDVKVQFALLPKDTGTCGALRSIIDSWSCFCPFAVSGLVHVGKAVYSSVFGYLRPVRDSTVIAGCTHYLSPT
jgi:hypothetical protein